MGPLRQIAVETLLSLFLASFCLAQIQKPSLTLQTDGSTLASPANLLPGTAVDFTCSFSMQATDSTVHAVIIRSRRDAASSWNREMQCHYILLGDGKSRILTNSSIQSYVVNGNDGITCSRNSMTFTLNSQMDMPKFFDCLLSEQTAVLEANSDDVIIRSHSQPTTPVIRKTKNKLVEGEDVTFTCVSEAKPPPALSFQVNGVPLSRAKLSPNNTNIDSPSQQSVLEYTTTVERTLAGELVCSTVDHPYSPQQTQSLQLDVIYGPDSNQPTPDKQEFSRSDVTSGSAVVSCDIEAYPEVSYEWLFGGNTVGNKKTIALSEGLMVSSSSYPADITLTCVGTNKETNVKAQKEYTVTITNSGSSGQPAGESNGEVDGPKPWIIAVAVVVPVAVIILLIIIICCCVKKRKNSAKNSKAKQAREDQNGEGMSRYQSSTSSLARQGDPKGANYHENPTLPMEYRYNNVEQFAEAIDDMPRSRRPIALEDMGRLDDVGPPNYGEAPPAYSSSLSPYSRQEGYPPQGYDNSYTYGVAC